MATILVPWKTLNDETLQGIVESFILREGTDYGPLEYSLEEKTISVMHQVKSGQASIVYDDEIGTCNIVTKEFLDDGC